MSEIDEIKARIDIVELIGETVNLRRAGKNYTGFCPFHPNSRTPAFHVFPESGTWHCFSCHEGGDIFSFVMKKENQDFKETLQSLAAKAGIILKPRSAQEETQVDSTFAMRDLLDAAIVFFRHHLRSTEAGKNALNYLHQRKIEDNSIELFDLGYAPQGWDVLTRTFQKKGFSEKDLIAVGLVAEREKGGVYDRFRHRLMIPIRDAKGQIAGFGARSLAAEDLPKYLNSPQTNLFNKGHILYGLYLARKPIRIQEQVVIVEGYLDVIALHQKGYQNVVSPMGTALTEHQLRLIKPLTKKIILALDADAAGQKATLRGLEIARENLTQEIEVGFDVRGLLRKEERLQADLRVALLPEGLDPDEVVNQDEQLWKKILENAKPIVDHVIDTLVSGKNVQDAKEKEAIAQQVLPLIEDIPSSVERESYRQHLARVLKLDERALWGMHKHKPSSPKKEAKSTVRTKSSSRLDREGYILGVLLREPNMIYQMDRVLQENKLERLLQRDFQRATYQEIFACLKKSVQQEDLEPYKYIQSNLAPPLYEVMDQLYAQTDKMDMKDVRLLQDILRAILWLRRVAQQKQKEILDFQLVEAQKEGNNEELILLQSSLKDYLHIIACFDQTLGFIDKNQLANRI